MIIGLVGFIGSGKDTVAGMLVKQGCIQDSFASPLKDVCASMFGWPRHLLEGDTVESRDFRETPDMFWTRKTGIDNFTPRLALQLVGTDVLRNNFHKNIWIDSLEYRMRKNSKNKKCIVISDARFQNELKLIKAMGGKIIWVQRDELPDWYDVAVDANNGNAVSRKIMQTRFKDVHESEWNWVGVDVDYVVHNTGTIDDLQQEVDRFHSLFRQQQLTAI